MFLSRQTTCAALVFEDEDSGRGVQDEPTAGGRNWWQEINSGGICHTMRVSSAERWAGRQRRMTVRFLA